MSLENLSREEIKKMSMLELAQQILIEETKALDFRDIYNKIVELKEITKAQNEEALAQFYTDLNVDGRFITLGANMWGLKRWYPFEQIDEDIHNEPKKKKKKAKKKVADDDLDIDDDELDLDLDDDDILDDDDFDDLDEDDDEDFDDIDDEDFDDFDDDDDDVEEDELEDLTEIDEDEIDEDLEEEK
ncbi:DNA-directed RNA polymerase subunit delta [Ornithinibacillus californiensis]|uniref:DNA-directed RNA polymerase subunit delta n=1 Tax=Ornithinibacillus californiensis TaxID=161536 RepID=UPI00064DF257|nr:DNA-directed RNA polymerase subunit delta [Ornithinibacillus californiensis]